MKRTKLLLSLGLILIANTLFAQRIGLLMDSYFIDRWYTDQRHLTDKIKELGGQCIVEMPHGDPAEQVRLGKKLIAEKVDALILIPTDAQKAIEIVDAAKAANIPVIVYDRFVESSNVSFFVSYNSLEVGNLQAQFALDRVPKGNYLLVNGPSSDNNAILFRQGQLNKLRSGIDKGDVKVIGDISIGEWSEMEALMKIEEFLSTATVMPDVIVAANDAIATGALQAIPPALAGKVVITGQDAELLAVKNIVRGHQSMTIYKPIMPLAYQAATVAMALAKKTALPASSKFKSGKVEVKAILLNPIVVDASNYVQTVVKDGHISLVAEK